MVEIFVIIQKLSYFHKTLLPQNIQGIQYIIIQGIQYIIIQGIQYIIIQGIQYII